MQNMTEQQARIRLTSLCSAAEYCLHDLREKMRRWGINEEVQNRLLDYLTREKYVDEMRYCRLFVKDKIRFNQWGRLKIEMALLQKHIDRGTIANVLNSIHDDDYLEFLRPLLRKKAQTIIARSDYERNMRLLKFAERRGFTYDLIRQCLSPETSPDDE